MVCEAGEAASRTDFISICTDESFVYHPFCDDFGPLSLGNVYRYCVEFRDILSKAHKPLLLYTRDDVRYTNNSAFLLASFLVCPASLREHARAHALTFARFGLDEGAGAGDPRRARLGAVPQGAPRNRGGGGGGGVGGGGGGGGRKPTLYPTEAIRREGAEGEEGGGGELALYPTEAHAPSDISNGFERAVRAMVGDAARRRRCALREREAAAVRARERAAATGARLRGCALASSSLACISTSAPVPTRVYVLTRIILYGTMYIYNLCAY